MTRKERKVVTEKIKAREFLCRKDCKIACLEYRKMRKLGKNLDT